MQIEKCVLYVDTTDVASRSGSVVVDGKYKFPVTLPKLKCLEDETEKYFPYLVYENLDVAEVNGKIVEDSDGLSIRERQAYVMFKNGSSMTDIAREMRVSSESIRMMLSRARVKLGEPAPEKIVKVKIADKNDPKFIVKKPMTPLQLRIYTLYKEGKSRAEMCEILQITREKLRKTLRVVLIKTGEPMQKLVNQHG